MSTACATGPADATSADLRGATALDDGCAGHAVRAAANLKTLTDALRGAPFGLGVALAGRESVARKIFARVTEQGEMEARV